MFYKHLQNIMHGQNKRTLSTCIHTSCTVRTLQSTRRAGLRFFVCDYEILFQFWNLTYPPHWFHFVDFICQPTHQPPPSHENTPISFAFRPTHPHEWNISFSKKTESSVGLLVCRVCGLQWHGALCHLEGKCDLYGNWIDALEEANTMQDVSRWGAFLVSEPHIPLNTP